MSNISTEDAVSVARNISDLIPNSRIAAAHRALDDKIDEANAGARGFSDKAVQQWKEWRLVLKSELVKRGIESSERPARAVSFQHQGAAA